MKNKSGDDWADIFADAFAKKEYQYVLAFKYNTVTKHNITRKGVFSNLQAKRTHDKCNASYEFKIVTKPGPKEDVIMSVTGNGNVSSHNES